jgi:transcription elongation factor SPT5
VKLREIKNKIERRTSAKDRSNNVVSTKDIVRVVEGSLKVKFSSPVYFLIIRSDDT